MLEFVACLGNVIFVSKTWGGRGGEGGGRKKEGVSQKIEKSRSGRGKKWEGKEVNVGKEHHIVELNVFMESITTL